MLQGILRAEMNVICVGPNGESFGNGYSIDSDEGKQVYNRDLVEWYRNLHAELTMKCNAGLIQAFTLIPVFVFDSNGCESIMREYQ